MLEKMQLKLFSITLVLLVAAAFVTAGVGCGGGGESVTGDSAATARIEALLANLPQHGSVLGSPEAPVTLQFFGDLKCPESQQFTTGALPFLIREWVRSGKLMIEFRSLQRDSTVVDFKRQQVAALAAGMQSKMWYFLEFFYHQQRDHFRNYATEAYLRGLARQVGGLDLAQWEDDRLDRKLGRRVTSDGEAARKAGFHNTPAFLIGRTGDAARPIFNFSLVDPFPFEQAIEELLEAPAAKT